jgi:hypothetical protein
VGNGGPGVGGREERDQGGEGAGGQQRLVRGGALRQGAERGRRQLQQAVDTLVMGDCREF